MIEEDKTPKDTQNADDGQDDRQPLGYLQGVFVAGAWAFIALLLTALLWPNLSERTKFFTGNLWNLVIAFAVIAQVIINRKQWHIMEKQWKAMRDSLEETRKQATASQDAVKAARYSIEVAQEGLYDEQRAYVGIGEMKISRLDTGQSPTLTITWVNGGKTPAWRFRSMPHLVLGEKPTDWGGHASFEDDFSDIKNSFIPAGKEKPVKYETNLSLTEEKVAAINNRSKRLYVCVAWNFIDFKGREQHFFIWALYDLTNEGFVELEDYRQAYYPE